MAHQITDFGEGALKRMYLPSREEYDAEVRRMDTLPAHTAAACLQCSWGRRRVAGSGGRVSAGAAVLSSTRRRPWG